MVFLDDDDDDDEDEKGRLGGGSWDWRLDSCIALHCIFRHDVMTP